MDPRILLTQRAFAEIDDIVSYIALDAPETARRWRDSLLEHIDSLKNFPLRHGMAPEAQAVSKDVRQMMHGVYRVLYTVDADKVTVHGVRHGARRPLEPDELPGPS